MKNSRVQFSSFTYRKKLIAGCNSVAMFAVVCMTLNVKGQEFVVNSNGLIYGDGTIKELQAIVKKENLKYKQCGEVKDYHALSQGVCFYVVLEKGNVLSARRDIEQNHITPEAFRKKYPHSQIVERQLFVKSKTTNYNNEPIVEFRMINLNDDYDATIGQKDTTLFSQSLKGRWLTSYFPKGEISSSDYLAAMFILEDVQNRPLPDRYKKMIQYAECMIDTNGKVFFNGAHHAYQDDPKYDSVVLKGYKSLIKFVDSNSYPEPLQKDFRHEDSFYQAHFKWAQEKDSIVVARFAKDPNFVSLVKEAVEEAIAAKYSSADLEFYGLKCDTKENVLKLKRSRYVTGGCSQDLAPRYHAMEIATLSAETTNWEIFLRAHLDIMNDNFSRMSDGSYAYAGRKTYIRELEVLDIDVTTLLLGISFRIGNPSGNHYYGSISRLGRALSESRDAKFIEETMAGIIEDEELDDYNRVLFYYLYKNYAYYISDKKRQVESIATLNQAAKKMRFKIPEADFKH